MEVKIYEDESKKEYSKIIQMAKKANNDKYQNHSRDNLKRHITKKMQTTMIGALSVLEDIFGELWGQGKSELTEDQAKMNELWQIARTEILNNGNEQLRAAMTEIDQYTVKFNKMKYEFLVNKKEKE